MGSLLSCFFSWFSLGSSSRSRVIWPQKPAQVVVQRRSPLKGTEPEKISLRTLIETRCSSVLTPFEAVWWLFNGHLQTGYALVDEISGADPVVYDRFTIPLWAVGRNNYNLHRKLLRLKDGGTLGLDFAPPTAAGRVFDKKTPVIVALHGLAGGSYRVYVRHIIGPAVAPVEKGGLGYRAVVVNFRGCAGVPLTSPRLYGFSDTDDFRQAILYIAQLYPHAPLLGLGFSCGANVLTRYVAEEGESCRLVSACALASPWDILKAGHALEDNWFTRHVYSKSLTVGLKKIVCDHIDTIVQFPDSRFAQALPTLMSLSLPTMFQFDSLISVHSAASSPFDDAWAYYAYSSSHDKLDGVRIPFLALNSHDDPIAQCVPQDYNRNEWVTLVVTHGGGHLGWFQPGGAENRWARRPVLEWFRATGEDIRLEPRKARSIEWRDGWLVEVGSEGLSCQEIGGGGTLWPGKGGAGL